MEKPHTMRQKSGYDGKIAGLYDLEETIGKGHFAVVKLAKHVYTGEKVAIKVIDKNKLDDISRAHLLQEVVCMKLVQHPNVVRLYEVIDTTSKLYLILELGDGGDMYDYIMKHAGGLEEAKAKRYFKQIVRAINYCHKLHVVHRDLKPENVVFFEKLGIVKLTDFGFSNKFVPGQKLETSCGSLAYSAPEILLGDSYDAPAVDVWSLGVILYMLVCGVAPFQEANDSETLTMIMDCKYKLPPHLSKECCHLIENMLVRDPSVRFKLEDIAHHIWLQGDVPSIAAVEPDPSPLVTKDSVSAEEHKSIISYMLEKKVAPKDTILQSLEKNAYNHITATYYLLAERALRKQQQKQQQALSDRRRAGSRAEGSSASHHRHTLKPRAQSQSTDDHDGVTSQAHKKSLQDKPNLSPLALSPRATFSNSSPDPNPTQSPLGALMSPLSSSNKLSSSLQSPSQSHPSHTPGGQHRLCRAICDEHLIEEDEDDSVELAERSVRPANLHYNLSNDCILEEYASDDSDSRSSDTCRSPQRSPTKCSSSTGLSLNPRTPGVRPLHTVRSSPQLLKQIHEESEDEGLVISARTSATSPYRSPRRALMSPDGMKKYERRHKRLTHGSRGTSCSSSDASDNDENETRKRKEKLKGHFHRRDSSDQSSDTDGPSGPGAPPPTGGRSYYSGNNSSHEGGNRRDSNDDNKREGSKDKGKNGSSRQAKGLPPNSNKVNGCFTNNISLATSNLSLKSSTSSLTCRGDKYIVQETNTGQKKSLDNLVENLNKENHTRSRVIQVRSKDFSDLMTRFNHSKQQRANHGVSNGEDTPSKYAKKRNKQVKTDINSNGVYTNTMSRNRDHIVDTRVVDQTVSVRTKCCSLV